MVRILPGCQYFVDGSDDGINNVHKTIFEALKDSSTVERGHTVLKEKIVENCIECGKACIDHREVWSGWEVVGGLALVVIIIFIAAGGLSPNPYGGEYRGY